MHLLSKLIEPIVYKENQKLLCRHYMLYLKAFADELTEMGFSSDAVLCAAENDNVFMTEQLLTEMINELKITELSQSGKIDEELYFRVCIEEYKRGFYDCACDFLFYRKEIAERLGFPYSLEYNGGYCAKENGTVIMSGYELCEFASDFLENAGGVK